MWSTIGSIAKDVGVGFAKGAGKGLAQSFAAGGSSPSSPMSSAALAKQYVNEESGGVNEFDATEKDRKAPQKAKTSVDRGEQLTFGGGEGQGEDAWGLAMMWNDFLKEDTNKDG
jgi:hypothetical protein